MTTEQAATNSTMSPEALAAETAPTVKAKRWYIIHAHSGFEKKVAQAILETAAQKGLTEAFEQVVVPTENVVEVRRGKKTATERKFFPGYVLAKMDMTDATWQIVKTTPKVTGFLGGKGIRPQPITEKEAMSIFSAVEEGAASPRHTIHYDIGESVKIIDGPFESFVGTVEDVDDGRNKLKVSVSIFGRATPVELNFDQVHKVSA
jgi:transcriptional antiterminator NusG